jgi:hypothetical protein
VAGGVVAAAADGDLQRVSLREVQRRGHVVRIDAARDRGGSPVDQEVEAEPGPLVLPVGGSEHVAAQPVAKLGQVLGHPI